MTDDNPYERLQIEYSVNRNNLKKEKLLDDLNLNVYVLIESDDGVSKGPFYMPFNKRNISLKNINAGSYKISIMIVRKDNNEKYSRVSPTMATRNFHIVQKREFTATYRWQPVYGTVF